MTLTVRPIESRDLESFLSYWYDSSDEFMIGMGVDLEKMPTREQFESVIEGVMNSPTEEKPGYVLIWEEDGKAIGHSNINAVEFGRQAHMHLHMWQSDGRKKGLGTQFIKLCLPHYFLKFKLEKLYCEPMAENPAPNQLLPKVGFQFERTYFGIPGSLNYEQNVNVYSMDKNQFESIYGDVPFK